MMVSQDRGFQQSKTGPFKNKQTTSTICANVQQQLGNESTAKATSGESQVLLVLFPQSQMSGAAFPSPTVEMAEINRIQYELEYTEGISQKMRIPQMLKVAPHSHDEPGDGLQEVPPSVIMQVPDRIVIAGWCLLLLTSHIII